MTPFLSICIPSFNRPDELKKNLDIFCNQISSIKDTLIEIIVTDDCSTNPLTPKILSDYSTKYSYIKYRPLQKNIGLEKNLIECARTARGKYLWIFGNDDFLEKEDSLEKVIDLLKNNPDSFIIVNRTRRSFDLSKVITDNWMKLDTTKNYSFKTLKDFTLTWGLISIIGFISVNIFDRQKFLNIDDKKYYGTMYPQLGMMMEAFHDSPCILTGEALICHRTETQEEKKAALGNKATEKDFMSDAQLRDSKYFCYPFINTLNHLIEVNAYHNQDITKIPECTVINGLLIDFLINNLHLSNKFHHAWSTKLLNTSDHFFSKLSLSEMQKFKYDEAIGERK